MSHAVLVSLKVQRDSMDIGQEREEKNSTEGNEIRETKVQYCVFGDN